MILAENMTILLMASENSTRLSSIPSTRGCSTISFTAFSEFKRENESRKSLSYGKLDALPC
ncbi:hypothetical protein Hanom_Chr01g00063731 [Helianthus anomalus]